MATHEVVNRVEPLVDLNLYEADPLLVRSVEAEGVAIHDPLLTASGPQQGLGPGVSLGIRHQPLHAFVAHPSPRWPSHRQGEFQLGLVGKEGQGVALRETTEDSRGGDTTDDTYVDATRALLSSLVAPEAQPRRLTEPLALATAAALLMKHADPAVAELPLATRLGADDGHLFGTQRRGPHNAASPR